MVPPVPLFGGVPGGPELLVLLFIMLLVFGVPLVLLAAGVVGGAKFLSSRDDRRVEELEARVEELERELERERAKNGNE